VVRADCELLSLVAGGNVGLPDSESLDEPPSQGWVSTPQRELGGDAQEHGLHGRMTRDVVADLAQQICASFRASVPEFNLGGLKNGFAPREFVSVSERPA
jgi:hypothetical protein